MANPKIKWHYSPVMLQVTDEAGQPYTFSPDAEVLSRANHTGTQDVSTITGLGSAATKDLGVADGVAPLDATGKLSSAYLPALSITDVNVVASEAEQLALTVQEGDMAVRADLNKSFVHNGGTAGTMADWQELLTPTDAVLSMFGRTGAVTAQSGDYTAAQITVSDTGGNFTATDVEGALSEIPGMIIAAQTDYFTESRNTTSPNDTVPVHSWEVSGTEADIDIALIPKGQGAITAHIPDGTAVGGDKRGVDSIDLQRTRSYAREVAAGPGSAIISGQRNEITTNGSQSFIGGGIDNYISNYRSAIVGGHYNRVTYNQGFIGGGYNNQVNSSYGVIVGGAENATYSTGGFAFIGGGGNNVADGYGSAVLGGFHATTRGVYGAVAHASGSFISTNVGEAQIARHILRKETTDAAPSILTANGNAVSSSPYINTTHLPDSSAFKVNAKVVAFEPTTGDAKEWDLTTLVTRAAGAATVSLVGIPVKTSGAASAGATAWNCDLVADTTWGAVQVQVTGEASKTIHWVCELETVEVL
jgi:hypothetical protein